MPTTDSFEPDPHALRALRAQITRELLAKGLVEGTGKFMEVMHSKLCKRRGRLPKRTYAPIKKGRFH